MTGENSLPLMGNLTYLAHIGRSSVSHWRINVDQVDSQPYVDHVFPDPMLTGLIQSARHPVKP